MEWWKAQRVAILFASVASGSSLIGLPAFAQDTTAAQIGEIVVTAQKREQSVMKVPLSVQAVGGHTLQDDGVTNIRDLTKFTPSLFVQRGGGHSLQVRYSLRGVSNSDLTPSASSEIAYYIDEMPINTSWGQAGDYFDVDRVEILNGPQGTLWGKNTTAGVVQVISRGPTDSLQGYGFAEFGNGGEQKVEAAVSGPIVESKLDGRLSVFNNHISGYYNDPGTEQGASPSDTSGARLQLLWTPESNASLLLKYETENGSEDIDLDNRGYLAGGADSVGYIAPVSLYSTSTSKLPKSTVSRNIGTAKFNYEFSNHIRLIDIAGLFTNDVNYYSDDDASPQNLEVAHRTANTQQYSNELRLESPDEGRLTWIAGLFYFYEDVHSVGLIYDFNQNPLALNTTSPAFGQQTNSYAAFGSVTYDITDKWKLIGGLRYTDEEKRSHVIGTRGIDNPANGYFADRLTNTVQYLDGRLSSSDRIPTWDVTSSYDLTSGLMLYVRVAKGFRSTAFNDAPFSAASYTKEPPEQLVDYEGGFKWSVSPSLSATGGIFYYDYSNKLVSEVINNIQTFTSAPATVKGVEGSVSWRPISGLELGGATTLLDARYGRFPNAVVPTVFDPRGVTNLTNRPLPNAPRVSVTLNAQYKFDTSIGSIRIATDWSYRSSMFFRDYLANINEYPFAPNVDVNLLKSTAIQPGYWLGNVSVTYQPTPSVSVTAFVRNVANQAYTNSWSILTTFSEATVTPGDPRSYGIAVRYNF